MTQRNPFSANAEEEDCYHIKVNYFSTQTSKRSAFSLYVHKVRPKAMDEGTERHAVPPSGREVFNVNVGITFRHAATPLLQASDFGGRHRD